MKKTIQQDYYTWSGVKNQQLKITLNTEIIIPENDIVRFVSTQLEELDYSKLYSAYSGKIRKSQIEPAVMFKVLVYAYINGIYTSRKIEQACQKRIDFMWLLDGYRTPDHCAIARFRSNTKSQQALEDLFYQYVNLLEVMGETEHDEVFVDGTKLESKANKYTFVWKKNLQKYLEKTKEKSKELLQKLGVEGYATKQKLKNKLDETKQKIKDEKIEVKRGRGHHKPEIVRTKDSLQELYDKWTGYEEKIEICGETRNSYSKTDTDATFMHMKDDHMCNSQLKPGYNVQFCVNSEYITGIGVFSNRTDYGTLTPMLKKLEDKHGKKYKSVVADSGYESLSNYKFLQSNKQEAYIKPNNYESSKKRKYKEQIGRMENMAYYEPLDYFLCKNGRILDKYTQCIRTTSDGIQRTISRYRCENCTDCNYRKQCCKAISIEARKEIEVCWEMVNLRKQSLENITTEKGKNLRVNRSIQVEGAFGQLKHNRGFKRFLTGGNCKVSAELYFLGISQNVKKYYNKCNTNSQKTHLFQPKAYLKF